jgi:hypothetical protein
MNPSLLLRIAAFLLIIHLAGHTAGHLGWDEPKDPGMQEVVNTMKGHKAEFMGASRSMADYFEGYSIIFFMVLIMSISLLFRLSYFTHIEITKATLWSLGGLWLAIALVEYGTFFPFAALVSGLAGLLILGAILTMPEGAINDSEKA